MSLAEGGGLPRTHLRLALLLLLADDASHGYELLDGARELGLRTADAAGVYRTLRTLEHDRSVSSKWEPSQAGPARRTYALTDSGRAALADGIREVEGLRRSLNQLLARFRVLSCEP